MQQKSLPFREKREKIPSNSAAVSLPNKQNTRFNFNVLRKDFTVFDLLINVIVFNKLSTFLYNIHI